MAASADAPGCSAALTHAAVLIVELGGRDDCVVRLLPPLNVTAEVVDTACDILIEALQRETGCESACEAPIAS